MSNKINFFVFNIKLQTEKTGETKTLEYIKILQKLSESSTVSQVSKNEAIKVYSLLGNNSSTIPKYVYGLIGKGTFISGDEVNVIDGNQIVKRPNIPTIINPITNRFIFVPEIHRLGFERVAGGTTEVQFLNYLLEKLPLYVDDKDILEVVLEKDEKIIEEIKSAKAVYSLSYKISYTNDDLTKEFGEELDEQLKLSKVGVLSVKAVADNKSEGMIIEDSVLLRGGLELAEKNGEIQSARIIPIDGDKIITVTNKDKPKRIELEVEEKDNFWMAWSKKIINLF